MGALTGNLETSVCEPQGSFPLSLQRTMGSSTLRHCICKLVHIHSLNTYHVLVCSGTSFNIQPKQNHTMFSMWRKAVKITEVISS